MSKMISQCYDGASVMSGNDRGVQRILQNKLGRTVPYVHCFNHRLHLTIIAVLESIGLVNEFFEILRTIYKFFHRSKIQSLYAGSAILKLINIRWAGHVRAVNSVSVNYSEIIKTLPKVK